jgi:hypothetical protein
MYNYNTENVSIPVSQEKKENPKTVIHSFRRHENYVAKTFWPITVSLFLIHFVLVYAS